MSKSNMNTVYFAPTNNNESLSSVSSSRVGDTLKLEKPSDDVFEFEV